MFCVHNRLAGQLSAIVAVAALFIAVGGCGGPRARPVEPDKARQALHAALEAWQAGRSIDELRQVQPGITVQDFDWIGGIELVEFEIQSNQQQDELNLRCPVRLRLRDRQGNVAEKHVIYAVATAPVITVFREMSM
jgi:hypothetical protein